MLKEVRFSKKPAFILTLEKSGGTNYKVYEDGPLTILDGIEPKGKKKKMIRHITVNSKNVMLLPIQSLTQLQKNYFQKMQTTR